MGEGRIRMLMQDVINKVKEISEISGYTCVVRKPFFSLAGRLTIMIPFFQEIRDVIHHATRDLYDAMASLLIHLETTRKLLQQGSSGSKIYLVLEREQISREYEAVVAHLEEDLKRIYFQKLELSDEVKEQAEFVLGQFDRARGKQFDASTADKELYEDLFFLYDKVDQIVDPEVLKGVVQTLQLNKLTALEQESVVLNEMIIAKEGERVENIEKMFKVLNYIKVYLHKYNRSVVSSPGETYICARQGIANIVNDDNKIIPHEFMCPISLQLMHDPVIISTGQTYERSSIQTWIQQGNGTCPKTMQFITDTTLTPNFALRNLIAQWCTTNRLEYTPKGASSTISYICTPVERELIQVSIQVLGNGIYYNHHYRGAIELSQLAKRSAQIREAIGEAGAIPLLKKALKSIDRNAQKYAMKALLNLSICPKNKKRMVEAGAIPEIIDAMNSGRMKLLKDGANILVSLSVTDEIKFLIGSHGGLEPIVQLLREGNKRGRKEAATALFILCSIPCNIARALKFGVIPVLISQVLDRYSPLKDEVLALLDIMASHRDAKPILLKESHTYTQCFIEYLYRGSRKNQENVVSILLKLGVEDPKYLEEAQQLGVVHYLMELERNGSDEAKRKAKQLLQRVAARMHATTRKRAWIDSQWEASTSRSKPRRN